MAVETTNVESAEPNNEQTHSIARSTLTVMVAFGVAKVISLGQTFIIASVFGVSAEYDAFVTANRIPEQIFNLIAGGAIAFAFIPVFTGLLAKNEGATAWRTASHVVNTIFSVTFLVSLLAFIFAPWLIANVVAPGFDPDQQAQTALLMRILLFSTLIFSVSGIMMGILQSHNRFLLPALAPIMFDLGILFGVAFLIPVAGVYGIAIGAVIGAALHLGVQIPGLLRVNMRWIPELGLNDPRLRQIIRLMLPRVADLGVVSINAIITANILSRLGTGSASAFDWGWRLMQIPETLIGTAMGVVIFPTLAAFSSLGDLIGKRNAMSDSLRFILIATIPSAVGLILVGRNMISLLERGAFDASASALVFSTLQFFALGLVVHSMLEIIARSFYADKDTLTPLWTAIVGALITFGLSVSLSNVLQADRFVVFNRVAEQFAILPILTVPGNVGALALANSVGVGFEVIALMIVLRRRWSGLNENILVLTTVKTLVATLVMAVAILVVDLVWNSMNFGGSFVYTLVHLGLQVSVGGTAFLVTAILLRMEELRTLLNMVMRRQSLAEVTT